jgi:hypothetical protein
VLSARAWRGFVGVRELKRRAYAKLDDDKPSYLLCHSQPTAFFLKLLTFVYTVSFCAFWGLMHLWTRKWRG